MRIHQYRPRSAPRGFVASMASLSCSWLLLLAVFIFSREISAHDFNADTTKDEVADKVEARQEASKPIPTSLLNNVKINSNILPGDVAYFQVSQQSINQALSRIPQDGDAHQELKREEDATSESELVERQGIPTSGTVYVSINTCLQPNFMPQDVDAPPQLTLHISTTTSNENPGPDTANSMTQRYQLNEGFAAVPVDSAAGVYIGVSAPNITADEQARAWNFDVAASVEGYYHGYNEKGPTLYMIDSDANAALLVTKNLATATPVNETSDFQGWISGGPPLSIFAQNINDPSINGLRHSFCGLATKATFKATNIPANLVNSPPPNTDNVQMGITYKQPGGQAEQQFYVPGLNKSTTYYGFLAMTGNSTASTPGTIGGGGTVYQAMNFTTKADLNCQVIFNLTFCDTVNYAVPANPYKYSMQQLASLYDNSTQAMYKNFSYSLQQVPCNTTATAQYSLVKTCDDCAAAYKTWLCAVTMPKCADYTLPESAVAAANEAGQDPDQDGVIESFDYLMPRNVAQQPLANSSILPVTNMTLLNGVATNSSRNTDLITTQIEPGPYREILPCEDLCYELVRSCPASFGFGCPLSGKGLESSYGRPGVGVGGVEKCSAPGAVYYQSDARLLHANAWRLSLAVVIFTTFTNL